MPNFIRKGRFRLVIYLFCEGKTEARYLQEFIERQNKRTEIRLNQVKMDNDPWTLAQEAIKKFDTYKKTKNSEIWIVFDHDGRDKIIKSTIDFINNSGKDIHIAFMKPCIEIWPLMHNGINNVTTQAMAQSKLKNIMPSYKHDRNPYFDLNKMPDYEGAVAKAKQWQTSLSGAPEYDSAKFAGIYKLTEKIKSI